MNRTLSTIGVSLLTLSLLGCQPSTDGESAASSSAASSRSSARSSLVSSVKSSVASQAAGASRTITIATDNFSFSPAEINVKKGEKITLVFTGEEGTHGVMIPDLGINVAIPAGKSVSVELPTDTAGTFSFRCSIPCGPGHRDMVGTIVIS